MNIQTIKCEKCLRVIYSDTDKLDELMNCPKCGHLLPGKLPGEISKCIFFIVLAIGIPLIPFSEKPSLLGYIGIYSVSIMLLVGGLITIVDVVKAIRMEIKASKVPTKEIQLKIRGNVFIKVTGTDHISISDIKKKIARFISEHNCTVVNKKSMSNFIISCEFSVHEVGRYEAGTVKANRISCLIDITDSSSAEIFPPESFSGGDPPRYTTSTSGNEYGSIPYNEIEAYLLHYL